MPIHQTKNDIAKRTEKMKAAAERLKKNWSKKYDISFNESEKKYLNSLFLSPVFQKLIKVKTDAFNDPKELSSIESDLKK